MSFRKRWKRKEAVLGNDNSGPGRQFVRGPLGGIIWADWTEFWQYDGSRLNDLLAYVFRNSQSKSWVMAHAFDRFLDDSGPKRSP